MASCIPLEKDEAKVVDQCGQALSTAVHSKFGCTVILHNLHGMDAPFWDSSTAKKSKVTPEERYSIHLPWGLKVSVWKDDLTTHRVDAVVNAANEDLQHIGGLAFALAKAGGPVIQQESDRIIKSHRKVYTGDAVVTQAGNLPCKKIIHAVGPCLILHPTPRQVDDASKKLEKAINSILKVAEKENFQSVAIPAVSSGLFNFPLDRCAYVIVETLKKYDSSQGKKLFDVRLVNHDEPTVSGMLWACKQLLGPSTTSGAAMASGGKQIPGPPKTSSAAVLASGGTSHLSPVKLGQVTLHISKGHIEKQKTHIIVNSTGPELDLSNGAVTKAILQKAGRSLQEEVSKYRYTCKLGDVLKTKGYQLHSRFVYHVLCVRKGTIGHKTAEQILSDVISECLRKAEKDSCTSIAFPAIGCGVLNFRKNEVADIMTEAVRHFSWSYMGSGMDVHFVIFPLQEETFQAFAEKHASLQQSKPSASTSHMSNNEYPMYEEIDSIPTPSIEIRANFPEAQRAAKRWIDDVVNILRDKEAVYSIRNNYVQHFGLQENKDLMSLQDKFQVGLQVFFTDGQAGITIKGTPKNVIAAVLEVEAMCCEVQKAHALTEEAAMLYPLVRWRCKECPQLENPEHNATLEKAYLTGSEECKIENLSVDLWLKEVKTKHEGVKYRIERKCFFKHYQITQGSSGKSYFDRKLMDFKTAEQREFQDAGLRVVHMETVENCALKQHFELSRKRITGNPKPLYQRVSAQFCQLVSWVGFQREYAPPDEQAFGEGIYFTASVKSAMKLWNGMKEEEYVYIIKADVLTGKDSHGSPGLIVPPSVSSDPLIRCDSVRGGKDTCVIFNGHQALPLYIYTCTKTSSTHK